MRKLKFRCWNGIAIIAISEPKTIHELVEQEDELNPDIIIMQFTGLKDKNGKEIFEGDVVQFSNSDRKSKPCEVLIQMPRGVRVKFADGWHYDWIKINSSWEEVEVIGSVYENKELLEEGRER